MKTRKKHKITWKGIHKWLGLILTIFLLLFCISGIILNHRTAFVDCSVSRNWLPAGYQFSNYNNGIVKGTIPYDDERLLAYGNSGIWLTDRGFNTFADFNEGLPKGVDGRSVRNIVRSKDGSLWCAAQFGLYNLKEGKWHETALPGNDERVCDVTLMPDSCGIVALTRSAVYTSGNGHLTRLQLHAPEGYTPKVSLFKTLWQLHSGELFGTIGRVVVDIIAVILLFLCLTGIVLFILPYSIRKSVLSRARKTRIFKWNFRWHSRIGYYTLVLTILIAFTGMCLRPPLMIPFVMVKTSPLPLSNLDNENAWHDKLRGIRWDAASGEWLLSTTEGFMRVSEDFAGKPVAIGFRQMPPVSPMGITVFEATAPGEWLVGSFSGLYRWNLKDGSVTDYFTNRSYEPGRSPRPVSNQLISGFSNDLTTRGGIAFDYSSGADALPPMPQLLKEQPMSLWNFALELHVGRCYDSFLGPLSSLFVFLSGLLLVIILVSGLILHNKCSKKQTVQ